MKAKGLKVVQRIMNGSLVSVVSTFERRRDLIIEEEKMKVKALKVVQRIMNATLVQVLEGWRDRTEGEMQKRAEEKQTRVDSAPQQRVLKCTLIRSMCRDRVSMFQCWRERAEHKRRRYSVYVLYWYGEFASRACV
jgi:hypothetical protein